MSDEEDYSSEDDVDYVPTVEDVSEEEGSGDEEDLAGLAEDAGEEGKPGPRRERGKKKGQLVPRKRKGGIQLEGEDENVLEESQDKTNDLAQAMVLEKEAKKEEKEKKKADDLWSSFMSDVKTPPIRKSAVPSPGLSSFTSVVKTPDRGSKVTCDSASAAPTRDKMTITKVYDFAGESVKVTKEVDVTSREAQNELKKQSSESETCERPSPSVSIGVKRPAPGGGLGGLLNKIGKKPKMSVLDKSKLDWDSFKKDEGIEEDLKIHNRGKESYLDRMAFLSRSDVRQFEIEKSLRLGSSKR